MAERVDITASDRGARFDGATVLGLGAAVVVLAAGIAFSGSIAAFFDLPSFLIVIGGTAAATMVCFNFADLRHTLSALRETVVTRVRDPRDAAYSMLELADYARKNGALRLQGAVLARFVHEPVLHKGLALVIDGVPDAEIDALVRDDMLTGEDRTLRAAAVLRKAAEIAPAMGLIGTLIGLVQMLGNLGDPKAIGPAMAIALLTTFYGAVLANLVLNPLAAKLERNTADERLMQEIQRVGLLSIARKENVRRLEIALNSLLPAERKVQFYDAGAA